MSILDPFPGGSRRFVRTQELGSLQKLDGGFALFFALGVRDSLETRVPGGTGRRDMAMVEAVEASDAARGQRMELKF